MTAPDGLERVLVVSAHPDDVDFGASGTVATLTDAGVSVSYCIVTDGDAGGIDPSVPRSQIPAIRRAEQTAAAAVVGVHELHFLGHPDGRVEPTLELRRDLARVIRLVRPQRLFCPSPERNYRHVFASHPDHLAVGAATLAAVYPDARNPYSFPELAAEGLEPWSVAEVWMMGAPSPDRFVDVTDVLDRKVAALRCHASQHAAPERLDELIRPRSQMLARTGGLPEGRAAEAFHVYETGG